MDGCRDYFLLSQPCSVPECSLSSCYIHIITNKSHDEMVSTVIVYSVNIMFQISYLWTHNNDSFTDFRLTSLNHVYLNEFILYLPFYYNKEKNSLQKNHSIFHYVCVSRYLESDSKISSVKIIAWTHIPTSLSPAISFIYPHRVRFGDIILN